MKLNELADHKKARGAKKRRGLGIGSGLGKTSGRGHKGFKSRAGARLGGFEGGQTPIHMRLPKRGFSNRRFAKRYAIINLDRLQAGVDQGVLKTDETITAERLKEIGLIRHRRDGLRILGRGSLTSALTIEADAASKSAAQAIAAAGGQLITAVKPPQPPQVTEEA